MSRFFVVFGLALIGSTAVAFIGHAGDVRSEDKAAEGSQGLLAELKTYRHKLVYETNRDGNWDLYLCNADGSNPVNLTRTPDVDEPLCLTMYRCPSLSPNATRGLPPVAIASSSFSK